MKNYEITVVFHPDLEMNLDPALDKVKKIIESNGGQIIKEENEGKKRLGYPVNGQEFGIYDFFTVAFPTDAPGKVDGILNITDEVIRHMIVKEDPRRPKAAEADEEADAKSSTEEAAEPISEPTEEPTKESTEEKGE